MTLGWNTWLGFKEHIHKLKWKTSAQNNILRKLSIKWGAKPATIKTTALAFCYSIKAFLNEACRSITGCLRPTSVENVYLLAGIASPGVRRATTTRQESRQKIPGIPYSVIKCLKSRNSFVHSVTPLDTNPPAERLRAWTPPPAVCTTETLIHTIWRHVPRIWSSMVTLDMSKQTKNWNGLLQVEHAKMEIQWCRHHMWLWGADADYGPFTKVLYAASGMYDWRFNGIRWNWGVRLPLDEPCVVTRQEEWENDCPYWLVVWPICLNFILCFLLLPIYTSIRTPSKGTCHLWQTQNWQTIAYFCLFSCI